MTSRIAPLNRTASRRTGFAAAALAVALVAATAIASLEVAAQPALDRDYEVAWVAGFQGPIPAGAKLRFGPDGRFSGFGGCNRLMGTYSRTADALALSAPASTRALCSEPLMAFENAFVKAIAKAEAGARQVGAEVVLSTGSERLIVLK